MKKFCKIHETPGAQLLLLYHPFPLIESDDELPLVQVEEENIDEFVTLEFICHTTSMRHSVKVFFKNEKDAMEMLESHTDEDAKNFIKGILQVEQSIDKDDDSLSYVTSYIVGGAPSQTKTVEEWFKSVEDEALQHSLLINLEEEHASIECKTLSEAIEAGFDWNTALVESVSYWNRVREEAENGQIKTI